MKFIERLTGMNGEAFPDSPAWVFSEKFTALR
jgi:hypothetical protein